MTKIWDMLFKSRDAKGDEMLSAVRAQRVTFESSVSRFEDTVRELLDRNDQLRGGANAQPRP